MNELFELAVAVVATAASFGSGAILVTLALCEIWGWDE